MEQWSLILSRPALTLYSRLTEFPITHTSIAELASLCRVSPFKIRQAIAELEHHGFLSVMQGG